jgi:hypothetical protein
MNHNSTHTVWKSIFIGGTAAGVISLIPIINILNLFFMAWMGAGGCLTVYLLKRESKSHEIKTGEALLTGALSGVWGCTIMGVFLFIAVSRITPERVARAASLLRAFFPDIQEEVASMLQGSRLQVVFLLVFAVMMVLSIVSGAVGGLIAKNISYKEEDE